MFSSTKAKTEKKPGIKHDIREALKSIFGEDKKGPCRPVTEHEATRFKHRSFKNVKKNSKNELIYQKDGRNVAMGTPNKLFKGDCNGLHSCFTATYKSCNIPLRSPYVAIIGQNTAQMIAVRNNVPEGYDIHTCIRCFQGTKQIDY